MALWRSTPRTEVVITPVDIWLLERPVKVLSCWTLDTGLWRGLARWLRVFIYVFVVVVVFLFLFSFCIISLLLFFSFLMVFMSFFMALSLFLYCFCFYLFLLFFALFVSFCCCWHTLIPKQCLRFFSVSSLYLTISSLVFLFTLTILSFSFSLSNS